MECHSRGLGPGEGHWNHNELPWKQTSDTCKYSLMWKFIGICINTNQSSKDTLLCHPMSPNGVQPTSCELVYEEQHVLEVYLWKKGRKHGLGEILWVSSMLGPHYVSSSMIDIQVCLWQKPFVILAFICFRREYCASEQAWCSGKYECIHKEFLGAHINMNFLSIHIGPRTTLKTCMYIFTYIHIHLHTHSHLHSQMREEIATVLDRKAV